MRTVRILEQAAQEAAEAAAWYETERLGLGSDFAAAVDAAIDLIEENILPLLPLSGEAGMLGGGRIILRRFPYDIVCIERDGEALVIAIAHHSRKPGYWRYRLQGG